MNTQQSPFISTAVPNEGPDKLNIRASIITYLYHWPLFLISLVLAYILATIYLSFVPPVYEIKASIIIKDESKTPTQQSALHELDISNNSKIIENEIEILKSKKLITSVINDLQLSTSYHRRVGWLNEDLYNNSPIRLEFIRRRPISDAYKLFIEVKDTKTFLVKDKGEFVEHSLNTIVANDLGSWMIKPSLHFEKSLGSQIEVSFQNSEKLAIKYQSAISVALLNKLATTVLLTINDENPQRGKDILNRLIFVYNLNNKIENDRETKSTIDFIDQRLASLNTELTGEEKTIEGFKSSRGLTDINSDSQISLENMQANDTKLNEVNVQLSVIDGIENYINNSRNSGRAPATLGVSDPALSNLVEQFSQLQLQHDKLLATTPETNPDFEAIDRQLSTTRLAIKENVNNIKISLWNTKKSLESLNSKFERSIKNIPIQERQYISIKRQQSIKENLYKYLLQKREEASVSYAATLANDRLVDQAYVSSQLPIKSITLSLAFIIGLGFPATFIYGRNRFQNRITHLTDIQGATDLSVLSELSYEKSSGLIAVNNPGSYAIGEQFRTLRTRLIHMRKEDSNGRIILLTSSVPGEGKSFVTTNLALTLAKSGRKTIILEMDLRKPKISEEFNLLKDNLGISDFLTGTASFVQIVQKTFIENLDFINCGSKADNPSELLERNELSQLILKLRLLYDEIIVDSPPVHLVPDALILSRVSDVTLYLIRQGFTRKSELTFIKQLSLDRLLPNTYFIFNGIQSRKYGYGYNYENNYYSSDEKPKIINRVFYDFTNRF